MNSDETPRIVAWQEVYLINATFVLEVEVGLKNAVNCCEETDRSLLMFCLWVALPTCCDRLPNKFPINEISLVHPRQTTLLVLWMKTSVNFSSICALIFARSAGMFESLAWANITFVLCNCVQVGPLLSIS